ncbi:alpha/beta hydrolase fold domain-containing protein [Erythrobacter aquimaris]|uniref:Alpha/beta hydrolase fold domain-containing protein n=1 Tax=Qipengyuania aquimaris TaxID=255984 RepID=A0A6I4TKL7_9SPHN|nr:alpha/beta hydrolase [Qipengyuania aquimaris]MXO95561.1 alpha/beta hydrolase fold domain-containing protein [Qipengyuania aquimaris]
MADTEHFVRDDVRGFLDMLEQIGGKGVEEVGAVEGRVQMKTMGQLAEAPARDLPIKKDLSCPGPAGDIPLRFYDAKDTREAGPCVIFIHGGGFVIGDIEVYDSLCTEIAHQLDLPVVSVEYRLAPEHPFPAAPDDCEAAARWVASSPEALGREITGLVITGDSAGGNLTIVTTNQLVNEPADVPVIVQAPIYPVASDVSQHRSLKDFAEGFLLTGAAMAWFTEQYGGDPKDPRNTPMVGDCSNTPPTVVCTAGLDPLRDSGREYAAHLIQQGTEVIYLEFPGIIHGFTTLRKAIPSGQKDLDAFLDAIKLMVERYR